MVLSGRTSRINWRPAPKSPYDAERRNLVYDALFSGFWVATLQFAPLTAVTLLSMVSMSNVAAGGRYLLLRGALAQLLGAGVAILLFGLHFNPGISVGPGLRVPADADLLPHGHRHDLLSIGDQTLGRTNAPSVP